MTVPITIPFGLTTEELVLEPHTTGSDMYEELARLIAPFDPMNEAELIRILTSAVLLKDANPHAGLGACLHTAVVWERG
jgi:hypothetical protein